MSIGKVFIYDHPLIKHKVSILRDKNTDGKKFRELVTEISMLMVYEATKSFELQDIEVETPIQTAKVQGLANKNVCLVPILRAGLGMVEGILSVIPTANVGHIGLYRDAATLEPVEYYCNLPVNAAESQVLVLDPMLATGGSASAAIGFLKKRGINNITLMCLISVDEGISRVQKDHPDVNIYCAARDEKLNDHAYIVPGLGDAGDRMFGTK
jgi:uracil phosphoribosyltransferase